MADNFLDSILEALMPAAGMEQPMALGGPEKFSPGVGFPQPRPQPPGPMVPPPGMSVHTGPPAPVSDQIRKAFEPAYGGPPPAAPAPVPGRVPGPIAGPVPRREPQEDPSVTTAADVQRFIRSVATGAARVDPRSPAAAAIAQGAAGALQNSYGEKLTEKKQARDDRRLDIADRRADTALDAQLRRDARQEQEYNRKVKRDEDVGRERDVRIQERLARISQLSDSRIRPQDITAFNTEMRGKARLIYQQVKEGTMTPEQGEKELENHRRTVIEQYARRDPGAKAPAPAAPGAKPPSGPGNGTREMPHSFDGLDQGAIRRRFDELKPGEFYINPADGKPYQKK